MAFTHSLGACGAIRGGSSPPSPTKKQKPMVSVFCKHVTYTREYLAFFGMHRTLPDGTSLHTLPNGLRIVISQRGETGSAVVAVVVAAGSKHETEKTSG